MPDRRKIGFGLLNPVEEPQIGKFFHVDSTSALQTMREAAKNVFKKDALSNNGPFKGIVLRVDEPLASFDPSSWIAELFGSERPPLLRSLKVRIPEIHAMLPDPAKYGPNAGGSNKIIDLYPSFIAQTEEISNQPVSPGDIVFVDYGNRENLSHPQYLGRIFETSLPGAVGEKTNKEMVDEAKKATLNVEPPAGDEIGGEKNEDNQLASAKENEEKEKFPNEDVGENEHIDPSIFSLPPMGLLEEAFSSGQSLGFIELVEMEAPEFATKQGVFIAKFMFDAWMSMVDAARKDDIILRLSSGFRSFAQQEYLYNGWRDGIVGFNKAARPGFSNHQNGSAFDIAGTESGTSRIYRWLDRHADRFGFVNSGKFFREQTEFWHFTFEGNK